MKDKFQINIDGFLIHEYRLSWSNDYQHWYVLYYDEKYPSEWESFATIEYEENSSSMTMTYKSRFGFYPEDFKNELEMKDAEQRFAKFMDVYLEENKLFFLLNSPERVFEQDEK